MGDHEIDGGGADAVGRLIDAGDFRFGLGPVERGVVHIAGHTQAVALPSNFSDLRQLSWLRSATDRVPLDRASVDDMRAAAETSRSWDAAPLYELQGDNILFFPTPNAVYNLSIYYDSGIYVTATSDSMSCQPGWDEWMVLDVCARVRMMEEVSAADFLAERAKVEADIVKQAMSRDRFQTHQVRDLWEGGEVIDSRSLYVRR